MQLLVAAEQMQDVDRAAIKRYAIPGLILMENAGRAFVDVLNKRVGNLASKKVLIVSGKGNNGGDGFVIARHLANRGCRVVVALLSRRRAVKGDAKANLSILLNMARVKESNLTFLELLSARDLKELPPSDVIVDAVFGTGFSGEVTGIQAKVIEWVNRQNALVASVDIPSGVNASTGVVENLAVEADLTVTMGLAKIGHYIGAGRDHSGIVTVADISIPHFLFSPKGHWVCRVTAQDVIKCLPPIPVAAHKYSVGKLFILGGSRGLTGAAYMCAQAAMRAGAGGVILGVPKSIHGPLIRKLSEVMVLPLDETSDGTISPDAEGKIEEKISWADAVAIGPGLSQNSETRALTLRLIAQVTKPIVIDADGLNALTANLPVLRKRKSSTILTPHVGELKRLIGLKAGDIEKNRVEVARNAAKQLGSVVVLKGSPTVTAGSGGEAYVNSTGNPGMATAGAGDVLTGIVASLLVQGLSAEKSAYAGVYLHGLAGDLAAESLGQRSMMALDIMENLPAAMRSIGT